ncbi:ATP-binding protein [Actinomadura scrupuli]|uniref:ATP-binding protein n=1 Tax=Actinomadura scrupuli TaxID=559629 RepID=UPI003D987BB0
MDGPPNANPPLIGRHDALLTVGEALDGAANGTFRFLGVVGDPGAGKTRLLAELAAEAGRRKMTTLWGRAAEFEQEIPFGVIVDALDDHLETDLPGDLGEVPIALLGSVFPALSSGPAGGPGAGLTGLDRYKLYRAVRQLLDRLAAPSGLALILDDVHWADDSSVELLDHLVRHPPAGRVLIAAAYRPAQAAPRLATLVDIAAAHGCRLMVTPLSQTEVAEFLGPQVSRAQCEELYEASGGNPFYLEALARMGGAAAPAAAGADEGELPPAVRAALQMELTGMSSATLQVAQAAAVAADEFEPALVAVAAEVSEEQALAALDEMAARDVVRAASAGRFRFRHPLVRHAVYGSAAAGWRLGVHARIAARLAEVGAPATARARHVERSGRFGDRAAIATLTDAARAVAAQAPATATHWLKAALRLVPESETEAQLGLLLELARLQAVSGLLLDGRETAHRALRLLPAGDHDRRARAVRFCAMIERLLDRPQESRALVLAELRQMPDPRSAAAVLLRLRLVAESLWRTDFRAAQAVLDMVPDDAEGWEPSLPLAVAALRVMPAWAAGRIPDAIRYLEAADRRFEAAPDEHLAEWMDALAFLCFTELFMGRYDSALRRFDRVLAIARATGQIYIVTSILSGQARAYAMLGRLAKAAAAAEEAAELARMLHSGQSLAMALSAQSLIAGWSGDHDTSVGLGEQAVRSGGLGEWGGAQARYARAVALINAGRLDEGTAAALEACGDFDASLLDLSSLLSCCEIMAQVEAARDRPAAAAVWADRAARIAHPDLPGYMGLMRLARAHALRGSDPAASAEHAQAAAEALATVDQRLDLGRARLYAGMALAETGDRAGALDALRAAADGFQECGARTLHAVAVREQRRLGVRVPGKGGRGRGGGSHGLSRREQEVAMLVVEGHTNQQIAEKLVLSIRTVETHLSHVFAKLGVGSRVGLVKALTAEDAPADQ